MRQLHEKVLAWLVLLVIGVVGTIVAHAMKDWLVLRVGAIGFIVLVGGGIGVYLAYAWASRAREA